MCKKPCLVEKKIFLRLVSVMAAMVYLSYLVCHTTNLVYVVCMFLPSGSERKQKKMKTLEVYAMYLAQL